MAEMKHYYNIAENERSLSSGIRSTSIAPGCANEAEIILAQLIRDISSMARRLQMTNFAHSHYYFISTNDILLINEKIMLAHISRRIFLGKACFVGDWDNGVSLSVII